MERENLYNQKRTQRIRSQNGFALLSFLLFVIVLLGTSYFFGFFSVVAKNDLILKKKCITTIWNSLETQKKILEALLKLNPRALKLRFEHKKTTAQLIAATASGRILIAAALRLKLAQIQSQRLALDFKQKSLLEKSKLMAQQLHFNLKRNPFLQNSTTPDLNFALARDDLGLAPAYWPQTSFTDKMTSGGFWRVSLADLSHLHLVRQIKSALAPENFNPTSKTKRQCSASIERRGALWATTLKEGKPSLNF